MWTELAIAESTHNGLATAILVIFLFAMMINDLFLSKKSMSLEERLDYLLKNLHLIFTFIIGIFFINTLLFLLGIGIMIDTSTLPLFIYTLLAKITSIRLLFILFISSVTKEFKAEYLSISVFTVIVMGILAVFNFHFVLPYLNIIGSFVLERLGATYTNTCNFADRTAIKFSNHKGLLEGIYRIVNAFPIFHKILKLFNTLQETNTSNVLSTFRVTKSNPFKFIHKVTPLTKLSKFSPINIAETIPNKLDLYISYKGNTNYLTGFVSSFAANMSNYVSNCASLTCKVHLTFLGEKFTIHSVFENGNLQEYSFHRTPVNLKNKSYFNSFYPNGKDKVKELLALTDPSKIGSNLRVFMQSNTSHDNTIYSRESSTADLVENRGRKRTDMENSNVHKKRKTDLDSTTLDSLNISYPSESELNNIDDNDYDPNESELDNIDDNDYDPSESELNNIDDNDSGPIITELYNIDGNFDRYEVYTKLTQLKNLDDWNARKPINSLSFTSDNLKKEFYIWASTLLDENHSLTDKTRIRPGMITINSLLRILSVDFPDLPLKKDIITENNKLDGYFDRNKVCITLAEIIKSDDWNISSKRTISSLTFRPYSLKKEFFDWAVEFINKNSTLMQYERKNPGQISINKLFNLLPPGIDSIEDMITEDMISEQDIVNKVFDPLRVCSKLIKIKNGGNWNIHKKIYAVPCDPRLKNAFYSWAAVLLEVEGTIKDPGQIRIMSILNLFPEFLLEPALKECLITELDKTKDNSFNFKTIYDKGTKMKNLHGKYKINEIPCHKDVKKDFYGWALKIVEPEYAGLKKNPGDIRLNTLLEKIKPHVQEVDKRDEPDDNSFDFDTIYDHLIEMKTLHGSCCINKIPYEGKIKKDFYGWAFKIVEPESDLYKKHPGQIRVNTLLEKMKARRN